MTFINHKPAESTIFFEIPLVYGKFSDNIRISHSDIFRFVRLQYTRCE